MEGITLIDYFRSFHVCSKEYELSATARSVYFALLGEFNAAYWKDELIISDRQMLELSGVKSVATIHDARNLLKSLGFIDFRKGKNRKSVYRLLQKHLPRTPNAILPEHLPNTCRTLSEQSGLVCYTRAGEDDEDEKTDSAITNARARAGVKREAENDESASRGKAAAEVDSSVADAHTGALPLSSPTTQDIFKSWDFATNHAPLGGWQKYELADMAEQDFEKTVAAIKRAMDTKPTFVLKFEHFRDTYLEMEKEDEKVERTHTKEPDKPKYKEPTYTGNEPWANFDEGSFEG